MIKTEVIKSNWYYQADGVVGRSNRTRVVNNKCGSEQFLTTVFAASVSWAPNVIHSLKFISTKRKISGNVVINLELEGIKYIAIVRPELANGILVAKSAMGLSRMVFNILEPLMEPYKGADNEFNVGDI